MSLDSFFDDCNKIAESYEVKLIDVVFEYVRIEEKYKREFIYLNKDIIFDDVKQYFNKLLSNKALHNS